MSCPKFAAWLCLALSYPLTAIAQPAAAPAVGIITAASAPIYNQQSYVGRIQSPNIVALTARVTGYLVAQKFHDGDTVTAGQLLYVIEQPPYQAAVTQAQAALEQALAQSRNASLTFQRAQALLQTPAGAQSNVDSAKATALSGVAQIDSARAALQIAQINLAYTQIRAPIAGKIGATAITIGNVVSPSSGTLDTIISQDPMYVTFAVPAADALSDRQSGLANLSLLIQLPDGSTYPQTAQIDFTDNQISTATDTITWRGTIANPQTQLTDGEFITVILRERTPTNAIQIPRQAVITDQLGDYVLTLSPNNTVQRTPVTMGPQTNTTVQISSGLTQGAKIIVTGLQRIHPGLTVSPQPATNEPLSETR